MPLQLGQCRAADPPRRKLPKALRLLARKPSRTASSLRADVTASSKTPATESPVTSDSPRASHDLCARLPDLHGLHDMADVADVAARQAALARRLHGVARARPAREASALRRMASFVGGRVRASVDGADRDPRAVAMRKENAWLKQRMQVLEMSALECDALRDRVAELEWALDVVREDSDRVRDEALDLLLQHGLLDRQDHLHGLD